MSHSVFLSLVRARELSSASAHFPPAATAARRKSLLELGAGTGQQALLLQDLGFAVTAIDLPTSHYSNERVFDVIDYDGTSVPCDDKIFDVVFSSNVLEHVAGIEQMLAELRRVMRDDGVAIHLLPSPSCRIWSIPAHYVWLARRTWRVLATAASPADHSAKAERPRAPESLKSWLQTLFPLRHGERGCTLTEPYYYSVRWWRATFERNGFVVEHVGDNGLFYTMANALGHRLSLRSRERLAPVLGSACNLFVLRKMPTANAAP